MEDPFFLCSFAWSRNAVANKITREIALSTAVGKSPATAGAPVPAKIW
jgi:hypothetical protein